SSGFAGMPAFAARRILSSATFAAAVFIAAPSLVLQAGVANCCPGIPCLTRLVLQFRHPFCQRPQCAVEANILINTLNGPRGDALKIARAIRAQSTAHDVFLYAIEDRPQIRCAVIEIGRASCRERVER